MTSPGRTSIGFLLRFGAGAKGELLSGFDGGELVAPNGVGYVVAVLAPAGARGVLGAGAGAGAGGSA